jgi:hypothetical protein
MPPRNGRTGGVRPGAAHTRARTRSHRGSGLATRTIVVATLVALTVGVGGWYFFLRGSGPPTGEFMKAERAYIAAARQIPVAATHVQRQVDVEGFNTVAANSAVTMLAQQKVFKRIAAEEDGDSARVADRAARAASLGINAAGSFLNALVRNNVADANGAREQLESSITDLEHQAEEWKKL